MGLLYEARAEPCRDGSDSHPIEPDHTVSARDGDEKVVYHCANCSLRVVRDPDRDPSDDDNEYRQ